MADWVTQKTTDLGMPLMGIMVTDRIVSGERLRMTFDKKTRKLSAWAHEQW